MAKSTSFINKLNKVDWVQKNPDIDFCVFIADNEDFDREEIATYEEVARLFPRADFKRPVVLVGPPGVGR